jgi:hypothetical protein
MAKEVKRKLLKKADKYDTKLALKGNFLDVFKAVKQNKEDKKNLK